MLLTEISFCIYINSSVTVSMTNVVSINDNVASPVIFMLIYFGSFAVAILITKSDSGKSVNRNITWQGNKSEYNYISIK